MTFFVNSRYKMRLITRQKEGRIAATRQCGSFSFKLAGSLREILVNRK